MDVNRQRLMEAATRGILNEQQVGPLWEFLGTAPERGPGVRPAHALYYLGGLIAVAAMGIFMALGLESFGGWGLWGIAIAYGFAFVCLIEYFLKRGWENPAGIMGVLCVAVLPVAVYGLEAALGFWGRDSSYWHHADSLDANRLLIYAVTLAGALLLLWKYRLPAMVMPPVLTLCIFCVDMAPRLLQTGYWDTQRSILLAVGLLLLPLAFWIDLRRPLGKDFAFWIYFHGVISFWLGVTLQDSHSELGKFLYMCLNVVMILVGGVLCRRVFVVVGSIGVAFYLGYLTYDVFENSLLFPLALSVIGLGVIGFGVFWQRREASISAKLRERLPSRWRELLTRPEADGAGTV